jgi:hypothetical protein
MAPQVGVGIVGGRWVPQGTVLGPCLFSVFTDDADECRIGTTNVMKFADDTNCWKVLEKTNDSNELQETLENLSKWADRCGMSLNVDKCKVMHIRTNNPRATYHMNGTILGMTEEAKYGRVLCQYPAKAKQSVQKICRQSTCCTNPNH